MARPNRRIGTKARPKAARATVQANLLGIGPADDHQRGHAVPDALDAIQVELLAQHEPQAPQDHGYVGGLTAGHERMDGDHAHSGGLQQGGNKADHLVRRARRALQHALDARFGGGNDRQPIRPGFVQKKLKLVDVLCHRQGSLRPQRAAIRGPAHGPAAPPVIEE